MSNLQDLVPPLELCRQIPKGKFCSSLFVWERVYGEGGGQYPPIVNLRRDALYRNIIAPAPTMEEILREMAKYPHRFNNLTCDAYEEMDFGVTAFVPYRGKPGSTLTEYRDGSGATAALKLYMHRSEA